MGNITENKALTWAISAFGVAVTAFGSLSMFLLVDINNDINANVARSISNTQSLAVIGERISSIDKRVQRIEKIEEQNGAYSTASVSLVGDTNG